MHQCQSAFLCTTKNLRNLFWACFFVSKCEKTILWQNETSLRTLGYSYQFDCGYISIQILCKYNLERRYCMVIGFLGIRSNKEMHKILKEMKLGERNICHSFPICLISYYVYIYSHKSKFKLAQVYHYEILAF